MRYKSLAATPAGYEHVYLSPHLDDAALSCGGMIAAQTAAGQRVLVVNICSGAPRPDAAFSELARSFHHEWGLSPEQAVAARLDEDAAALATLGVDALEIGELDAIYRHPAAYDRRETLFSLPDAADPLLPELRALIGALRERFPAAAIYAPLGVGLHVDHQICCRAALEAGISGLALYEDLPYVARPGELERRMAMLGLPLCPRPVPIAATMGTKIAAVAAYASQLAELARSQLGRTAGPEDGATVMAEALRAYADQVGGERLWLP